MTHEEFITAGAQADVLRILRICMDWSIRDAAATLGISASYISEVENGKKRPSDKILDAYSRHLGLPEGFVKAWIATQQKHGYTYQKLLLEILSGLQKLQ